MKVKRLCATAAASVLVGLSLACSAVPDDPPPTSISFAQLLPGDSVHVQLVSVGCFGDSAFEFDFLGGAQPRVTAVRLSGQWSRDTQQFLVEHRSESRATSLTPDELAGLDNHLRYYRAGPGDGCSDQRILSLAQVRDGRTLFSERYIDNGCGDLELKGTTFWELLDRLRLPQ